VHVPVLVDEVRTLLEPQRGGVFVDCTVGLGGHARMLLEGGASRLVGIDRDTDALAVATSALEPWADRVTLVHANYRELADVLDRLGLKTVSGVLADFGVSSMQLDAEGRGFSFKRDEPLDMRMDRTRGETAAEMLERVDEGELADIIYRFGEERRSRQVAYGIVIVRRGVRARGWQRIDPATRTFQALRIWVNGELDGLESFIGMAASRLEAGGRLALISFHSLEDRIAKHTLRDLARGEEGIVKVLTKHPVTASEAEAAANPRARSAKLRAAVRAA
jgi:16S rRNA (cytosine1402-N4)-methyltransferase